MKLLILTQKMDRDDPILGFFHNWVLKLSERFESIIVICLQKGNFDLPDNVAVFSLGKENGGNRIKYVWNFYKDILKFRNQYDSVFVHMNQEYILLGGLFWKIFGRRVYLWRNHPKGSIFTKISVWLSDKVFCTSRFAFVAKYRKTSIMPAGIDIDQFRNSNPEARNPKSILFLGRISPIKKPDLLIEALKVLHNKQINFTCDFYGDSLPRDKAFYESLKNKVSGSGLGKIISFYKGVPNYKTPKIYNEHEIFINLTPTGSFDKTILEAAACGCLPIVANKSLSGEIDERLILKEETPEEIAKTINFWLNMDKGDKINVSRKLQKYVLEKHSLGVLVDKISKTFNERN